MKRLHLPIFTFIFLIFVSLSARAEYYMVYPGTVYYTGIQCNPCYYKYKKCKPCYTRCTSCCRNTCGGGYRVYYETPPTVYMESVSSRRHVSYYGSEEMVEYAWVPYP
jgi:hypothetical protein